MSTGSGSHVSMWSLELASCSGRLGDVDRESSRGGGEQRDGVPHLAAIAALSAHPGVLHHVLGVCGASEDAIGDTDGRWRTASNDVACASESLGVRAHVVARCDSTATSCGFT